VRFWCNCLEDDHQAARSDPGIPPELPTPKRVSWLTRELYASKEYL